MLEIKIGKASYPLVSVAKIIDNDDLILVFVDNNNIFWGQSTKTGALAPLKFKNGHTMWSNKVVKFV
jgi:hypothetical protein